MANQVTVAALTSAAVGALVSWRTGSDGQSTEGSVVRAEQQYPHIVVDGAGVEWTVREIATPQPWARSERCLVLNSRECVRRVWRYPASWRALNAEELLRLGVVD
ncbi:MAG: hypothetical protein H0W68_07765 [Gemmatimonadaceae bacterium]|nr:hypothetical protein [Gemmatimonadaceae bacterium]